jgi:hypothetical protein
MTHPEPFEFDDDTEEAFVAWFHGAMSEFTWRSEWFAGDCEVADAKTRYGLMVNWLHAAFVAGRESRAIMTGQVECRS